MITDKNEIEKLFKNYHWETVFHVGKYGTDGVAGLDEVNPLKPSNIQLESIDDIESILAFSEACEIGFEDEWLLLFKTHNQCYAFFCVSMVEQFEEVEDDILTFLEYPFKSFVSTSLEELVNHIMNHDIKRRLYSDELASLIEKEKLEHTILSNDQSNKMKIGKI